MQLLDTVLMGVMYSFLILLALIVLKGVIILTRHRCPNCRSFCVSWVQRDSKVWCGHYHHPSEAHTDLKCIMCGHEWIIQ